MSGFNEIATEGINKIWHDDAESQMHYLGIIAQARGTQIESLVEADTFFVPNNSYLAAYFGNIIRDPAFDCYNLNGECKWSNYLVIPIYNVTGEIVAFGGFNPFLYAKSHESGANQESYYQYSSRALFKKGNYVYCENGIFERALTEGYLFVVDGIFDAISLTHAGFNAAGLMSSTVTQEILVQLRMVKRIILANDNDKAGLALKRKLSRYLKQLEVFPQGKTKDIDELLNSEYRDRTIEMLEAVKNSVVV